MSYELDLPHGLTVITMTGDVTTADFQAYFRDTQEDPDFRVDRHRLVLAQRATSFPPSEEIHAISAEIRKRTAQNESRFAIVVDTPLVVGMANMILAQAGLIERYETFADEAAARAWIKTGATP